MCGREGPQDFVLIGANGCVDDGGFRKIAIKNNRAISKLKFGIARFGGI